MSRFTDAAQVADLFDTKILGTPQAELKQRLRAPIPEIAEIYGMTDGYRHPSAGPYGDLVGFKLDVSGEMKATYQFGRGIMQVKMNSRWHRTYVDWFREELDSDEIGGWNDQ